MTPNVLMFSIAQNGYGSLYRRCIKSHRQYAKRNGYKYILFDRPNWVNSATESAWLKIPIMLEALRNHYDWGFYIDADCEVRPDVPEIESLEVPKKSLYFVLGHSDRINSGVMLAKNTAEARSFFEQVLNAAEVEVPEEDKAPYENGHVIYYAKTCEQVQILDQHWNNTIDAGLNDYIRHYTGSMRQHYRRSAFDQLLFKSVKLQSRIFRRLTNSYLQEQETLRNKLDWLTNYCRNEFPLRRI